MTTFEGYNSPTCALHERIFIADKSHVKSIT